MPESRVVSTAEQLQAAIADGVQAIEVSGTIKSTIRPAPAPSSRPQEDRPAASGVVRLCTPLLGGCRTLTRPCLLVPAADASQPIDRPAIVGRTSGWLPTAGIFEYSALIIRPKRDRRNSTSVDWLVTRDRARWVGAAGIRELDFRRNGGCAAIDQADLVNGDPAIARKQLVRGARALVTQVSRDVRFWWPGPKVVIALDQPPHDSRG